MDRFRSSCGVLTVGAAGLAFAAIVGGCGSSGTPDVGPAGATAPATVTAPTVTVRPTVTVTPTQSASRPAGVASVPKKTTKPPTARATTAKPTVRRTTQPTREPTATKSSTSVYYANCSEVRAAGAAPIRRGDPGYSSKLDRDGDGIACET